MSLAKENPNGKNLYEVKAGEPKAEGNQEQPAEGEALPRVMGSQRSLAGQLKEDP